MQATYSDTLTNISCLELSKFVFFWCVHFVCYCLFSSSGNDVLLNLTTDTILRDPSVNTNIFPISLPEPASSLTSCPISSAEFLTRHLPRIIGCAHAWRSSQTGRCVVRLLLSNGLSLATIYGKWKKNVVWLNVVVAVSSIAVIRLEASSQFCWNKRASLQYLFELVSVRQGFFVTNIEKGAKVE